MPKQTPQELPRFPQLVPAASPTSSGASPFVPNVSLYPYLGGARLAGAAQDAANKYQNRRAQEETEASRAELSASPELINELLEVAPGDEEARRRIVQKGVEAGLYRHSDSPYFQAVLLETEARAAGNQALLTARSRITAGDHMPTVSADGDETPGLTADQILDQELAKYGRRAAISSQLGAAAFYRVVQAGRPVLQEHSRATLDARNLDVLQRNIGDSLATLSRTLTVSNGEQLGAVQEEIEANVDRLRAAHIANFREVAARGIMRGMSIMADEDPDRALLHLNTVVPGLTIAGQSISDNPRTSEILYTMRDRVRRAAVEEKRLEEYDRARVEREQLRASEVEILKYTREMKEGGVTDTEIRRRTRSNLEEWLAGKMGDPDYEKNAERLRREGLRIIDAVMSEDRTDPTVLDSLTGRISLATSPDELNEIEGYIRSQAGTALFGTDLERLMGKISTRRKAMVSGYTSDPAVARSYNDVRGIGLPDGLPEEEEIALAARHRQIERDHADALHTLAQRSGGELDPLDVSKLAREAQDQKIKIRDTANLRLAEVQREADEAILANATTNDIRTKFRGRLGSRALDQKIGEAQARTAYLTNLANDPAVQAELAPLFNLAADAVEMEGGDIFEQQQVQTALRSEFEQLLRAEVNAPGTDLVQGRPIGKALARKFVTDQSSTFRAAQATSTQEVMGEEAAKPEVSFYVDEALTGEDRVRGSFRASQIKADADKAAGLVGGGRALTIESDDQLKRLYGTNRVLATGIVASAQERLYASGLFAGRMSQTRSRSWIEMAVRREADKGDSKSLGDLYVAGMSPIGIPFGVAVEGKATVGDRTFKIPVEKIPPFSTPLFTSVKEFEKAWSSRRDELDKLLKVWGIATPQVQERWRDTQLKLVERLEKAIIRNGK